MSQYPAGQPPISQSPNESAKAAANPSASQTLVSGHTLNQAIDESLVKHIVRQVMTQMRMDSESSLESQGAFQTYAQQSTQQASKQAITSQVDVKPPVGLCTAGGGRGQSQSQPQPQSKRVESKTTQLVHQSADFNAALGGLNSAVADVMPGQGGGCRGGSGSGGGAGGGRGVIQSGTYSQTQTPSKQVQLIPGGGLPAGVSVADFAHQIAHQSGGTKSKGGKSDGARGGGVGRPSLSRQSVLSGFVTARQIEDAAAEYGLAKVALDARLTPLAEDYVKLHPASVQRVGQTDVQAIGSTGTGISAGHQGQWLSWSCNPHHLSVQSVTQRLHQYLAPSSCRADASIVEVVEQVAEQIELGRVRGAILYVKQRAAALCLLNRFAHVRAAGCNCVSELDQAIMAVGVNVLVIELPHAGSQAIHQMVDRLMISHPKAPANIGWALKTKGGAR